VCRRYFIHESFKIVDEKITTIKVVYHAFSERIVECFLSRHTRIFRCFQTCHINKFNIQCIIICMFVVINSFVIFFALLVFSVFRFACRFANDEWCCIVIVFINDSKKIFKI
jgi:hypothetical protein